MALANMTQEQTDMENRNHCKHIAEEIEAYAEGRIYKCPHCGEEFDINEAEETENGHICPSCKEEIEEGDAEQMSLYDYFDDIYDIEYRISGSGDFRSVCIMVACGGPNIYIDTGTKQVELYWWGDRANFPIHYDTVDEIDSYFEEMYQCTR